MLNQYRIGAVLGLGSYGKVKSCTDQDTGVTYAVKIIPRSQFKSKLVTPNLEQQEKASEEKKSEEPKQNAVGIEQEMDCLLKMNHMNIIKLHEIIDDPKSKKVYLVMDYCKGGTLAQ